MGVTVYSYISLYSFLMSIIWFTLFVVLSLFMRKLKYPIQFSVIPLATLLILSLIRMFSFIALPSAVLINSEIVYPAIMNFFRIEIVPFALFGFEVNIFHILIFIWGAVSLTLIGKHIIRFYEAYYLVMSLTYHRDKEAEKVLHEVIGAKKNTRVFRTFVDVPFTMGINPYIFLPENVEFAPDELRTVLRHEWSHIQGKDVCIRMILEIICAVFWWNPLAYVLKNNIIFTQELRSDFFAIAGKDIDFHHYIRSIIRLSIAGDDDDNNPPLPPTENFASLVDSDDELDDRLATLSLHMKGRSSKKRVLPYVAFYITVGALFVFSYTILLLPAHWESPYEATAESFIDIEHELGEVFRPIDTFLIDNHDGTFSLYIDGVHLWERYKADIPDDMLNFFIILDRYE